MKKIILSLSLILIPLMVIADEGRDSYAFYLRGGYESSFNVKENIVYNNNFWKNKEVQSNNYFGGIGVRLFDFMRVELLYNYNNDDNLKIENPAGESLEGKIRSDLYMANIYFDARIKSMSKFIVPYFGLGGGLSYNDLDEMNNLTTNTIIPAEISDKNYVLGAMVGIGLEFSQYCILDLGYQYRMTNSFHLNLNNAYDSNDFTMDTHNLRASLRIEF